MAINLELKIALVGYDEIISKIEEKRIQYVDIFMQKDIYYKFKNGLLKLRVQKEIYQLIKYNRDEISTRWSNYSILYLNGSDTEKFLSEIFEIDAIIEKERKLYIYKNTRIHLDNVKNLGKFIELETVVDKITQQEAVNEFEEVIKLLNLNRDEEIRGSYRNLLVKK